MKKISGPPVIGVGLPHAGPSEVLTMVPRKVCASNDITDGPGADVPFRQSTASPVKGGVPPAVHQMSVPHHRVVTSDLRAAGATRLNEPHHGGGSG